MRSRHSGELHAGYLGELLKGIEPEATTADDSQSNLALIHQALRFIKLLWKP